MLNCSKGQVTCPIYSKSDSMVFIKTCLKWCRLIKISINIFMTSLLSAIPFCEVSFLAISQSGKQLLIYRVDLWVMCFHYELCASEILHVVWISYETSHKCLNYINSISNFILGHVDFYYWILYFHCSLIQKEQKNYTNTYQPPPPRVALMQVIYNIPGR